MLFHSPHGTLQRPIVSLLPLALPQHPLRRSLRATRGRLRCRSFASIPEVGQTVQASTSQVSMVTCVRDSHPPLAFHVDMEQRMLLCDWLSTAAFLTCATLTLTLDASQTT